MLSKGPVPKKRPAAGGYNTSSTKRKKKNE